MVNKGADQTAQMRRLVCAFVVHKQHSQSFSRCWSQEILASGRLPACIHCVYTKELSPLYQQRIFDISLFPTKHTLWNAFIDQHKARSFMLTSHQGQFGCMLRFRVILILIKWFKMVTKIYSHVTGGQRFVSLWRLLSWLLQFPQYALPF